MWVDPKELTAFRETLPAYLQPSNDAERAKLSQRLGYALRARCDRIFGKLRLQRVGLGHTGVAHWCVVEQQPPVTVTSPPPPSRAAYRAGTIPSIPSIASR
jgi:hypothetical protein